MPERALDAEVPAAWVTADEVYGGDPALRRWLEDRHMSSVLAVKGHRAAGDRDPGSATATQLAARVPAERWVAVLPGLDPTIMGWKQRDWYLPETSSEVFDSAGNGGPSLWVDGRVVGAWAQTRDGTIHTHYFERVAAARRRELDQRIEELKSWIGDTRYTVRFPGDIHARLLGTRTVPGPARKRPPAQAPTLAE